LNRLGRPARYWVSGAGDGKAIDRGGDRNSALEQIANPSGGKEREIGGRKTEASSTLGIWSEGDPRITTRTDPVTEELQHTA